MRGAPDWRGGSSTISPVSASIVTPSTTMVSRGLLSFASISNRAVSSPSARSRVSSAQPSDSGVTPMRSHSQRAASIGVGSPRYSITMSMAVRLPWFASPMSAMPKSLMPPGANAKSSSRLRPKAFEPMRKAPVPG